jgi:hypothetical protein
VVRLSSADKAASRPDEAISGPAIGCDRPQPIPGKIWVATLCSMLFLVAYGGVICTAPDRLRESLLASAEPSVVSLGELAKDSSRDARNAILRGVRVESVDEKDARENSMGNIHQVHAVDDPDLGQAPTLFVLAPSALLPGSEETEITGADLRTTSELTGMLRRPNPLAYRVGSVDDDCGIPHDAWLLHLDIQPYQAVETLLIGGLSLLIGALALMAMMSQNWIPNRGLNIQVLFALFCLIGCPLRRHRGLWSIRMIYLVAGVALLAGGYGCVRSGDRGIVIDSYWLEYWAAAIGLVMLGLAIVTRVAWVVCLPERVAAIKKRDLQSGSDDVRPVRERSFIKFMVSLRTVSGGVAIALFVAQLVNNLTGRPIAILAAPIIHYSIFTAFVTYSCSHWLLQWITRGFCEREYSSTEKVPKGLTAYRQRSDDSLELAGFENQGGYRVRGSAFQTTIELHLGCRGMVIAEFVSLSGKKEVELHSILESGICVATASCKTPEGKPSTRWGEKFYSHCGETHDLEKLLRSHLSAVADLAEQHDTTVVILTRDDVIDVIQYSSRAFHDMIFQQGESKDQVGPAQYGRFRFPTGVLETAANEGKPVGGDESESRDSDRRVPISQI